MHFKNKDPKSNPHPYPLSTGGVSTSVAIDLDLLSGVVTGVAKQVPPIGSVWVAPDLFLTAISWVVVGQARSPLPLQPLSQITIRLIRKKLYIMKCMKMCRFP